MAAVLAGGCGAGEVGVPSAGSYRLDEATDAHGGDTFAYCGGRLAPGRFIYFGGESIGTVAVARVRQAA